MDVNLNITFCGVRFPNPFIVSKVPPNGDMEAIMSQLEAGWGGVLLRNAGLNVQEEKQTISSLRQKAPVYRGVDYEDRRMFDLGWIEPQLAIPVEEAERSIRIIKEKYPDRVVIAGMVGWSREEWLKLSRRLSQAGADLIECDFSVTNGGDTNNGGASPIAYDLKLIEKATRYVREGARTTPVMLKIPGTLPDRETVSETLKEAGADALSVFYEPKGVPGINLTNFVPFPNVKGKSSLSIMGGAAVKPYTLGITALWGAAKKGLDLSVIGGAYTWRDCVELFLMGASILQLHGAVLQRGVGLVEELKSGVSDYLAEKMISSVDKLIGKSLPFFVGEAELPETGAVIAAIDDKTCTRCGICYRVCEGLGYHAISFSSQRKPSIDRKKCVGDGLCVAVCPVFNCMSLRRISK